MCVFQHLQCVLPHVSVFVFPWSKHVGWQISVDNLTAIDGADVRMLRALVAAANVAETGLAHENGNGIVLDVASSSLFDTASFLQEWFVAEQRRESLWRSFHAAAPFHVNTSLPYDLHALKVREIVRSEVHA